jgi:hypothetical protein
VFQVRLEDVQPLIEMAGGDMKSIDLAKRDDGFCANLSAHLSDSARKTSADHSLDSRQLSVANRNSASIMIQIYRRVVQDQIANRVSDFSRKV